MDILRTYFRLTFLLLLACVSLHVQAQRNVIYDRNIRSLQTKVNGSSLVPPVLTLGRAGHLNIGWDELSHTYHRYTYRVEHCDRDWEPSQDIFESDYLVGTNDLPVENYANSFNTTQLYTHYSLTFPNSDTSVRLSGNYRIRIMEENGECVLESQFCVVEKGMSVAASVSGNTDIDFQQSHQQMSINVGFGALDVVDPEEQMFVRVLQNRYWENRVEGIQPNIRKAGGVEYSHNRELIFDAGNEFHRFEMLNVHRSGLNVDRMRWIDPWWHTILNEDRPPLNYISDEDHNGSFVIRREWDEDNDVMAEYTIVHFTLRTTPLYNNGDVYVDGTWAVSADKDEYLMDYNEAEGAYESAIMLKQGYYDYRYVQADGTFHRTMGSFYETENEYQVLIYYREQGGRYDRLVGYALVHN